ncbi:MAG TPA: hypothetical protein VET88_04750, partial [Gammaproteobacteria bacterium]|nr:hypothetical protein [Gammaproteobacteria bacterium]
MNAVTARMHYFPARVRHACIAFGCLLIPLTLLAGSEDLSHLQVSESGGVYSISLVMHMQVPADHVYQVLTDYEHIYRLDPAIVDSEILPAPDDSVVRVRTRINDCIAFFCMTIDRVEDVVRQAQGALQAR